MGFDFSLVDVFSDRPFGGNQLAVFPDAASIADETMQRLAQEFNFSETTFVLPPSDPSCTCRVRIFTPRQELPFAGHPTLGTAAVLARRNGAQAARQFVFEEGIGPVTVTVDGPEISLHLRSPRYEATDEAPPAALIAKALTLPEDAITESWYAGIGLRFCFVRVTRRDLVAGVVPVRWQPPRPGAPARPVLRPAGRHGRGPRDRIGVRVAGRQPGPSVTGTGRHLPYSDRPGRSHGPPQRPGGHGAQTGRPDHGGHRRRPCHDRGQRHHDTPCLTCQPAETQGTQLGQTAHRPARSG